MFFSADALSFFFDLSLSCSLVFPMFYFCVCGVVLVFVFKWFLVLCWCLVSGF